MDDQKLLNSFDTVWFYSNLLSPYHPNPSPTSTHINKEAEPRGRTLLSPDLLQPHEAPVPSSHDPTVEAPTPNASAPAEGSPVLTTPAAAAAPAAPRIPKLDQRRRRRRKSDNCREQQGVEQLGHLRFDKWRWLWDFGPPSVDSSLQRTVGMYAVSASGRRSSDPCTVGDGLAVREHLRSWAYAVACTVR